MIALAWIAIILPPVLIVALVLAFVSDMGRDWGAALIFLGIVAASAALTFSMAWGERQLKKHYANQPHRQEAQ